MEAGATEPAKKRLGVTVTRLRKKKYLSKRHGRERIGQTLGTSGLRRSGGQVLEEWNRRLAGTRAVQIYREMRDNSPIVGASMLLWESLMLQANWPIEARVPDPSDEQIRVRDFIRGARDDMTHPFSMHLIEAFTSLTYGWALCEETYKIRDGNNSKFDDGLIGWKDIALRGQATLGSWDWSDEDGTLLGMWQNDFWTNATAAQGRTSHGSGSHGGGLGVFIPIDKAVHYRIRPEKDNPEGNSILRPGYRSYYMVKRLEEIEAIGLERDLAGLPIIQVPAEVADPDAPPELVKIREGLEKLVQDIRIDERMGAVIPAEEEDGEKTGYKLSLLSTGGRNAAAIHTAIVRHETRLAMALLAQFLMLGQQTAVGSFALASSATNTLSIALGAFMDTVAQTFTQQAIERLCALNGFPPETWPHMVHGDVETPPLGELASFLSAAGSQGFLAPDQSIQDRLREWLNLPPREEPKRDAAEPAAEALEPAGDEVAEVQAPDAAVAEASEEVAETAVASEVALTGIQIDKALVIYDRVARFQMSRESGINALVSFFGISKETAADFIGTAGTAEFTPAPAGA